MAPVRVLLIAPSLDILGGQAVQANRLLKYLEAEPSVSVRFLPVNPHLPGPLRRLQQVKFVRTVVTEASYVAQLLAAARHSDVLHTFGAGYTSFLLAPSPVLLIGRMLGKPTILNYRDGRIEDHLKHWPSAVKLMRMATARVAPSGFLVDVFARFGMSAEVIVNIVETGKFHFRLRHNPRPVFLHNRGLEPVYNVPCTLRAFHLIQQKYPEASLLIAHDGPLRRDLERLAHELKLRNVQFLGPVEPGRIPELYDQADIYLMSPDQDNMPASVLECYASGLPLISTAAGGVPYIVDDGRTGLLVPLDNHAAMAAAALRLLEEEGLAARLAQAGVAECAKYRGEPVAAKWAALYRRLAKQAVS